ncbi:MAG: DinB family protein [Candidatus Eisenbacteria bacterium]|nr:DinB family protein [Candidatus Eisenbacteria bacterium]
MSECERIHDQLERAFAGNAWHGPALTEVLDGVDAARAVRRPLAHAHTIWEIVLHVAAWEAAALRRLSGEEAKLTDAEDWPAVGGSGEPAWRAALAALERGNRALRAAVLALPDARLEEPAPGASYSLYVLLHGVVQHDLHHAGQIALLKQG